jgi:uncharacterized protein (DUF305 family)
VALPIVAACASGAREAVPSAAPAPAAIALPGTAESADARFVRDMIAHHEGALTMAAQLLNAPGAREPELFRLVNDIDADQRAEIARMQRLLAAGQ